MKNTKNQTNRCIHLYNPKEEGLGSYDINYMNACKKASTLNPKNKRSKDITYNNVFSQRRAA